ncbi:LysR family transcriptional regulator [Pseudomonas aeruginosa]|nr:LysR family transcriptional regulator [Pseudomonas aeruginosa]
MIDLVMLKDFLVLCRIKSFSRAAQECHVSVSGLSRRIQTLEQWLGAPVFERHKHALELTEAGRQLQGVAQDAVRALDNLRQSIRERDEDAQRRIRFCAPHILSSVFFPHWIPRLQADFRSAKFSVDCDYLPQCLSRLRDGSVDYVVALLDEGEAVSRRLGIDSEAEFQRLELGHEQLVAVCAPDAAGQPLFNLDRLQTEALSFLGYSEECHLGWALEPLLRDSGLFLQRHHSSSQTEGLRFFAQSRLGVAWLPHTLVREDLASRRLVRAGGQRFDVPLRYTLIRRRLPLPGEADRLWTFLGELARPAPRYAVVGAAS